ncbi:MAG: putative lipid II flippase FtsW [Bdellovibrionota bacterium]
MHSVSTPRKVDGWLLACTFLLLAIGVLMVFSTTAVTSQEASGDSATMIRHHFVHIVLGFFALAACLSFQPQMLYKAAIPCLVTALFMLCITLIPGIGYVAGGARRWLVFGPLRVQPGEIAKLCAIVYFASYIDRHREEMSSFRSGVAIPFAILGMFAVMLLLEPDFGSTVIILTVVFCQLFLFCRVRHMLAVGMFAAFGLVVLIVSSPYRLKRLITFMDPFEDPTSSGYQLIQSLIAVGSGGLSGTGLGAGRQKLFYLPAAHTDFIFAVIAEELGILGAVFVLGIFLVILYRGLQITRRLIDRPYLACLSLGCTLLIVIPALLNMGVVLGMLPTKGMVLPLVAYGGTAMVVHLAVVGILLRLSRTEV